MKRKRPTTIGKGRKFTHVLYLKGHELVTLQWAIEGYTPTWRAERHARAVARLLRKIKNIYPLRKNRKTGA